MFRWPYKDPDERRAYPHDWSPRLLPGDGLVAAAGVPGQEAATQSPYAQVRSGTIQIDQLDLLANGTTAFIKGGVLGEVAELLVRVHTALGEVMDETFQLTIRER